MKTRKQFLGLIAMAIITIAIIGCKGDETHTHQWGEWIVTKVATTTEEGEETRTCATCGEKETRPIAKLPEQPVEQSLSVVINGTGGKSVTVEIKYMALPNTTPSYMPKLQQALSWIDDDNLFGSKTGTIYINVITGSSSPVKGVSKTLDVGEGWLSTASDADIYDTLTQSSSFINNWFE